MDYDGRTALHLAACEGHTEVLDFLCTSLFQKDSHGNEYHKDALEILTTCDLYGSTPLDDATRLGKFDAAFILSNACKKAMKLKFVQELKDLKLFGSARKGTFVNDKTSDRAMMVTAFEAALDEHMAENVFDGGIP